MFSVSQTSILKSVSSPLFPRASHAHSKIFLPEFVKTFTLIWISATEHLGIRIKASLTANPNHREILPDSWTDDGMAENQGLPVKLVLNAASSLRR